MNKIDHLFSEHKKAKIAYLTAGDGGAQKTVDAALALVAGGVNLLEIGIPFSDPTADGPVIQRASERALLSGTHLKDVLWIIQEIRQHSEVAIVLFTYLNPLLAAGYDQFLAEAATAGIDGLLLVDCPLEESHAIHKICQKQNIHLIYIVTPSTTSERIKMINQQGSGFLYYACQKGTTGMREELPNGIEEKIAVIKKHSQLPIVIGFGISNQAMAKAASEIADGVVVGSFFVKALEEGIKPDALSGLAKDIFNFE